MKLAAKVYARFEKISSTTGIFATERDSERVRNGSRNQERALKEHTENPRLPRNSLMFVNVAQCKKKDMTTTEKIGTA